MRLSFYHLALIAVMFRPTRAVFAAPVIYDSQAEVSCHFGAFVIETDPKGLNVRAEPNAKAKILGTIPPMVAEGGIGPYFVKPEVEVIGGKNGWIKIQKAKDNPLIEDMTHLKPRKMYNGIGWVSGKKLSVKSQSEKAYDGPSMLSKVLHKKDESTDFDKIDSYKILGCQNDWVWVEDKDMKKANRYWLNQLCDIQETTCESLGKK